MQYGELRADRCSRIINQFFQFDYKYLYNIVTTGLRIYVASSNHTMSEYKQLSAGKTSCKNPRKIINKNKDEDIDPVQGDLLHDLPEWLEEFTENLVDERVPALRSTPASSSRESGPEPPRKVVSGKHSIHTHFPKDRNCEMCKRTKITRAPCRRCTGKAVLRAASFGNLITADIKVLSEGCESRNNHRYAVVVQDLATQWIQAYSVQNNNFTGKRKGVHKSSSSRQKSQKSFTLTIP